MAFIIPLISYSAPTIMTGFAAKYLYEKYKEKTLLYAKTEDLVELAKEGKLRGRVHGRNWILTELVSKIGTGRGVVLLHGNPGTGKTALIEEVAYQIANDEIPELKNAKILRLKPKETIPKGGLIGWGKEFLYGSLQELLQSIIEQLKSFNQHDGTKTILFIDEFQKLVATRTGKYDLSILMNHLSDLDEYGVILVGATSDLQLVEAVRGHSAQTGMPLARRLKDIEVPEMTPKEVILALDAGRKELGNLRGVDLKQEGAEAIVLLTQEHNKNRTGGKFPDIAVKFFEEVAEFAKNRSGDETPIVDCNTVADYLSKTSPNHESARIFKTKVVSRKAEAELEDSFFDRFFPLLPYQAPEDPCFQPIANLSLAIESTYVDPEVQTCLVKINSHLFLEKAAARIPTGKVRTLSVKKMVALNKKNPNILSLFKHALAQMGDEILLLKDTDPLLQALTESEPVKERAFLKTQAEQPKPAKRQSELDNLADGVAQIANQGVMILRDQIGAQLPQPGLKTDREPPSTIIRELSAWLSKPGNRSIIAAPSQIENLSALANFGWPLIEINPEAPSASLSTSDLIDWLKTEAENIPQQSLEHLVFLVYRLWKSEKDESYPDLCYAILNQIGEREPNDETLLNALCEVSKGSIRRQDAEKTLQALYLLEKKPNLETSLVDFSPELFNLVEEQLQTDGALIRIDEADKSKASYLCSLVAKYVQIEKNSPAIDLSLLVKTFPSPWLQDEYLEKMAAGALIIIDQKDLSPATENLAKKLHQRGFHILCTTAPKQTKTESLGLTQQIFNQGAELLKKVIPASNIDAAPLTWLDEAFAKFESGPLDQKQFRLFFFDLLKELAPNPLSEEVNEALFAAFFYLYKLEEKPLSLDRIRRSLAIDLQKEIPNKQAVAEYLFQKYGNALEISKNEILYQVAPPLSGIGFRLLQLVKKIATLALRILLAPLRVSTSLAGRALKYVGGSITSGILFFSARKLLFG